jgi:hypothetical protein
MKTEGPNCRSILNLRDSRAAHLQLVFAKCTDCGLPIRLEKTVVASPRQHPRKALRCAIRCSGYRLRLFDVLLTGETPRGVRRQA